MTSAAAWSRSLGFLARRRSVRANFEIDKKEPALQQVRGPRKILLGGDPFRLAMDGSWEQRVNVEMLRVIATGLFGDIDAQVATPEAIGVAPLPGADRLALWARRRTSPLTAEVERAFGSLLEGAFYLGFETPDYLWRLVGERCAGALDLRLHPCRFGPDYYLLVRSHGVPLRTLIDHETIQREMAIAAVSLQFDAVAAGTSAPKGADGVIALQMPTDSALLDDWGFANLADHADELRRFAGSLPVVWIKPHPHSSPGEADRLAVLQLENGRFTDRSTYHLIASRQVDKVMSLSSSVLHEAVLLGAAAVALRPDLSHGFPVRSEFVAARLGDLYGPVASWLRDGYISQTSAPSARSLKKLLNLDWGTTDAPSPVTCPPAIPDTPLAITSWPLTHAKSYGWYNADAWGVWSSDLAALDFTWPVEQDEPITFEMTAAVYTGGRGVTDEVEIWSGGRRLDIVTLPTNHGDPATVRFDVPKPVQGEVVQLVFYRRLARRPCDVEAIPDFRRLGMMLFAIGRAAPPITA